jgi:hypothetical protein
LLATNSCVVVLFLVKCAAVEFSPDLFLTRSTAMTWIHLSGFRELYSSCHLLIVLFVYSRSGIRSEQVLVLVKTDVFNFDLSQIERELIFDDCVLVYIFFRCQINELLQRALRASSSLAAEIFCINLFSCQRWTSLCGGFEVVVDSLSELFQTMIFLVS